MRESQISGLPARSAYFRYQAANSRSFLGSNVPPHLERALFEQEDFAIPGQAACHGWVPMVHRAGEVLVEDQRHTAAGSFDELRLRGLVGINHCGRALITQSAPHRVRALGLLS